MVNVYIADVTLREKADTLSFKEKTEVARQLDRLNVDVIETAPVANGKTDVLFLHTIAPIIKNSILSCPTGLTEKSVQETFDAIKGAKKPRLNIIVPVSTVQMEYLCHKKPDKMLELIKNLTQYATAICDDVEVSFADSTRAEKDFLYAALNVAIESGAKTITLCDSAGIMLPAEFEVYIQDIYENVPKLKDIVLSVECSNELKMAVACAISCVNRGVKQIKTVIDSTKCPGLKSIAHVFRTKSEVLGVKTGINVAVLENSVNSLIAMTNVSPATQETGSKTYFEDVKLTANDDIKMVSTAITKLGYDLTDEDIVKVYDEFLKLASKKSVGAKELDAIVASTAMQVAPTYKLKSYVINSGNVITPTANIEIYKDGELLHGFFIGDGPIDAAFMAIEQITGHHYELDDFQIQSITRGREAMGESIVKLRHEGKLFSGKGTSTDIVGASINAYINALNKICFEEGI